MTTPPKSPVLSAEPAAVLRRYRLCFHRPNEIADKRPTNVRPNVPATLPTRVFAPLSKRLEGRLCQHDLLCFTVSRDNSHGELIVVPVVGGTLTVNV